MERRNGKFLLRLVCFALLFVLLGGVSLHKNESSCYFSGEAEVYYRSLIEAGFPEDYAAPLTELHLLHPTWSFVPLLITESNPTYTWDHILREETKMPDNNLIFSSRTYRDYHHRINKSLYDSGYYQVSAKGLAYFMDPRNFLNETDIFQFYLLSSSTDIPIDAVDAVLQGTFMEDAVLENGKSFSEYFLELGEIFGINPVYLAVRARQEQGVNGTSPLVRGTCGEVLFDFYQNCTQYTEDGRPVLTPSKGMDPKALQDLDGLYNLFNVGASGNGSFSILYNAANRAIRGSESMASIWGSSSWNTLWKSIYGGTEIICNNFINRYQDTLYLQKFNVDPRASERNFWGQYMQNVTASLIEARTLFSSFASMDALDMPATFSIPVYGYMPASSPDPANGNCSYLASADRKYDYSVLCNLAGVTTAENSAVYSTQTVSPGGKLEFRLLADHSYGIESLEYRWYGEAWKPLSDTDSASLSVPIDFSEGTSHILLIRGVAAYDHENGAKKNNAYFLCAVIYVDVEAPLPVPTQAEADG